MHFVPEQKPFHRVKSKLIRTSDPTDDPVSLLDIKRNLYLGDTHTEDEVLEDLLPIAVDMVERDSQRALKTQTWKLYMDDFPHCPDVIELRKPPVQSVTSITYIDTGGDEQTLAASKYDTDLNSEPGRIIPKEGTVWPCVHDEPFAVTVTFDAGYTGSVPPPAFSAIMLALKAHYFNCSLGEGYHSMIDRIRWDGGI